MRLPTRAFLDYSRFSIRGRCTWRPHCHHGHKLDTSMLGPCSTVFHHSTRPATPARCATDKGFSKFYCAATVGPCGGMGCALRGVCCCVLLAYRTRMGPVGPQTPHPKDLPALPFLFISRPLLFILSLSGSVTWVSVSYSTARSSYRSGPSRPGPGHVSARRQDLSDRQRSVPAIALSACCDHAVYRRRRGWVRRHGCGGSPAPSDPRPEFC